MKPVRWLSVAEQELAEAIAYYNSQSNAVGWFFLSRVLEATAEILRLPESGRIVYRKTRRKLIRPFPYGLLYRNEPGEIVIVSLMHLHRRPGYWTDRL